MLYLYFPCLPNKNKSSSAVRTLATLAGINFGAMATVQLNNNEFKIAAVRGNKCYHDKHVSLAGGQGGALMGNEFIKSEPWISTPPKKKISVFINLFINSLIHLTNVYQALTVPGTRRT